MEAQTFMPIERERSRGVFSLELDCRKELQVSRAFESEQALSNVAQSALLENSSGAQPADSKLMTHPFTTTIFHGHHLLKNPGRFRSRTAWDLKIIYSHQSLD